MAIQVSPHAEKPIVEQPAGKDEVSELAGEALTLVSSKYAVFVKMLTQFGLTGVVCFFTYMIYQDFTEMSRHQLTVMEERAKAQEKQIEVSHELFRENNRTTERNQKILTDIRKLLSEKK